MRRPSYGGETAAPAVSYPRQGSELQHILHFANRWGNSGHNAPLRLESEMVDQS